MIFAEKYEREDYRTMLPSLVISEELDGCCDDLEMSRLEREALLKLDEGRFAGLYGKMSNRSLTLFLDLLPHSRVDNGVLFTELSLRKQKEKKDLVLLLQHIANELELQLSVKLDGKRLSFSCDEHWISPEYGGNVLPYVEEMLILAAANPRPYVSQALYNLAHFARRLSFVNERDGVKVVCVYMLREELGDLMESMMDRAILELNRQRDERGDERIEIEIARVMVRVHSGG